MKIFKVQFNDYDYDQYDSFIVVAESPELSIEILKKEYPDDEYGQISWSKGYKVTEINQDFEKPGILLGSFNAG